MDKRRLRNITKLCFHGVVTIYTTYKQYIISIHEEMYKIEEITLKK